MGGMRADSPLIPPAGVTTLPHSTHEHDRTHPYRPLERPVWSSSLSNSPTGTSRRYPTAAAIARPVAGTRLTARTVV